jgi:lauroyl/myristoyl acyltransferase
MNLQTLINSRLGVELVLSLGRMLPRRAGAGLAHWIGSWFAGRRDEDMVRAVRANQWVLAGEKISAAELDRTVRATFVHSGLCIYDFYHNIDRPRAMLDRVVFSPEFERLFQSWKTHKQGVMLVGPHMSNFDLVMRVLALRGLNIQVLTHPDPPRSYKLQNRLRQQGGLEATPISILSLRQASARLQAGGFVMTGLDRPVEDLKYRPRFFGRPSAVTVAYIRLAMRAKVPVVVLGNQMRPDGSYYVQSSDPIWMQPHADLESEVIQNAETVLDWASHFICQAPQQWLMFYPVWPEVVSPVPGPAA